MPNCCPRGHSQVFFAQTGEQTTPYISNASQGDLWINPTLKLIYAYVDCYWQQVSCCETPPVAPVAPLRSLGESKIRLGLTQEEQKIQNGTVLQFDSVVDFLVENAGFYTIQFQANFPADTALGLALKKNYNVELSRSRTSGSTISLLWTGHLEVGDRVIVQCYELVGEISLENSFLSVVQL